MWIVLGKWREVSRIKLKRIDREIIGKLREYGSKKVEEIYSNNNIRK